MHTHTLVYRCAFTLYSLHLHACIRRMHSLQAHVGDCRAIVRYAHWHWAVATPATSTFLSVIASASAPVLSIRISIRVNIRISIPVSIRISISIHISICISIPCTSAPTIDMRTRYVHVQLNVMQQSKQTSKRKWKKTYLDEFPKRSCLNAARPLAARFSLVPAAYLRTQA